MTINARYWISGVGVAGWSALAAAAIGVGVAPVANATGDDGMGLAGSAVADTAIAAGNQFDPAVIPYSQDPSNVFAPVYTISPVGPEEAINTVTDPNNMDATDTFGTQDFNLSILGFPADSFTGTVEYTPTPFDDATGLSGILGQLSQELGYGGSYSEEITTLGGTGTVLPDEPTTFIIDEFGFGYGNVFEGSVNTAGTATTVGDFVLTPYGADNITPFIEAFLPQGAGITDAVGAVDPSGFADLLSSIGL